MQNAIQTGNELVICQCVDKGHVHNILTVHFCWVEINFTLLILKQNMIIQQS